MKCFSADEIVERAAEKIIPLDSQIETVRNIAALLSLHLKKLAAIDNGVDQDFLPTLSELIIAPTGSGKTYLISKLAEAVDLPFYTIDCSMLTMSGYKGVNMGEAFRVLKDNCSRPGEFERAIVLFDEFDKCAYRNGEKGNVQPNFLKLLEGEPVSNGEKVVDTSQMLFLFSGAFQGLNKLVAQRCQKKSIGFASENEEESAMIPTMEDVQTYGFNRELLGRIGSLHIIQPLKREDYRRLLTGSKTSVLEKYSSLFSEIGVRFSLDESVCDRISEMAMNRGMGARAVESVIREKVVEIVGEIDRNPNIVEATLTLQDDELGFNFTYGERKLPERKQNDFFASYLCTDKGINELCSQWAMLAGAEHEELCYNFLQTTLRYLKLEADPDEWTMESVKLFVKQTRQKGFEEEKTTLDILMGDVEISAEPSEEYRVMLYYYKRFKATESSNSFYILRNMVKKICAIT